MSEDRGPEWYRAQLTECLRRVPQSVNAGGLKTAQAYKAAVEFANKQMKSPRAKLANLQSALQRLQAF